uniref:Ig-like domain-containing protein n=1 Tax=Amphilophus citrinellus TaxID=61819 RepID=A0A3Q0RZG0_AMPCI
MKVRTQQRVTHSFKQPDTAFLLAVKHDKNIRIITLRSHVIGPTQPVVAMIGDDIILPCHLEPAVDAVELTVEWSRQDLKPRFVYLRRNGVELLTEQNLLYTRRTSLSVSKLQCGDISLKLSTVKLSDAGTYKCHVPTFGAESVVELTVGKFRFIDTSSPSVVSSISAKCVTYLFVRVMNIVMGCYINTYIP